MLKIMTLLILTRFELAKKKANTESNGNISDNIGTNRIDDKITNLLSSTKVKQSSEIGFFTSKASLAFTSLRKTSTKVLNLYYFDLDHHIWIKIHTLSYIIDEVLSQLTFKIGLTGQIIHKLNPNLLSKIGQ